MQDLELKLKQEILDYLSSTEKMNFQEKADLLLLLIKKYMIMDKAPLAMTKKDLDYIVSVSKGLFTEMQVPVEIEGGHRPIPQHDFPSLCIIEATVGFLNKEDCLKKLPKFKYKK